MPLIEESHYKVPFLFRNRHFHSIYPTLFRKIKPVKYVRSRLSTADQDFIDLDFSTVGSKKIVVILHGLEGSSQSKSVTGMASFFNDHAYDTVSMNFRGCSGEPNRNMRYYHSGETDDMDTVLDYIISLNKYTSIHFVAFSLGGNVLLKYIGEKSGAISTLIKSSVAISVPCDLKNSVEELGKRHNAIYMKRFIRELKMKLEIKAKQYPGRISLDNYGEIKTFKQFDERYTAPIHGFESAEDYWEKSSSLSYLDKINIPVLLINAQDDPFLGAKCFPYEAARRSSFLYLETPRYGGHVGFLQTGHRFSWSEKRALEFISRHA